MSFVFSFEGLESDVKTNNMPGPGPGPSESVSAISNQPADVESDEIVFEVNSNQKSSMDNFTHIKISSELEIKCCVFIEPKEYRNYDILKGKYEGGGKIWECSIDLAKYVNDNFPNIYNSESSSSSSSCCLELGCGHGVPGLVTLRHGYKVYFTDFNKDVLYLTHKNVVMNSNPTTSTSTSTRYFYGDWLKLSDNNLKQK